MARVFKLMQLLAYEKSAKNAGETLFTKTFQAVQKADLFTGFFKTYAPRKDNGDTLPPEKKLVVIRVEDSIKELTKTLGDLFDIVSQKDATNCNAKADIIMPNGEVLLKDVPATHLLWLEKKLVDLITFAEKLPVLDPADRWAKDASQNLWATEPAKTARTKKVEDFKTVAPATDKHPAQVVKVVEDVIDGDWTNVKYSSALEYEQVKKIVVRAKAVARAVKIAREEANTVEVVPLKSGTILNYIFGVAE